MPATSGLQQGRDFQVAWWKRLFDEVGLVTTLARMASYGRGTRMACINPEAGPNHPARASFLAALFAISFTAAVWAEPKGNCRLEKRAFCDDFNARPSVIRGRGGDLDPQKWSVARLVSQDFSGNGPVANPVRAAPVGFCKTHFRIMAFCHRTTL